MERKLNYLKGYSLSRKNRKGNKTEMITLQINLYNINWERLEKCSIMMAEMTHAINDCVLEALLEAVNAKILFQLMTKTV